MLLKSSSRNPSPIGINIKRIISKTPTNLKIHSPSLKKKFTPTVNKSFTCYKEKIQSKHQRASSFDRNKENSVRKSKNRSFRFTYKVNPRPREMVLDQIKEDMEKGNYSKVIELVGSVREETTEVLYSRGVCYMHLKQYKQAIDDFLLVLDKDPFFDKQLYIAIYMCYLSCNQFFQAIKFITKGIRNIPGFSQGYLLRGQLLNKLKKYEKAVKDFKKITDKNQAIALYSLAESYAGLRDWDNCLKTLDQLSLAPEFLKKSLLLKSKVFYDIEKFDDSLYTLSQVLTQWPEEYLASYYKAKINYEVKNFSEAALSFEQAIQGTTDTDIINSSVFYLGNIKLRERDFYGALHTFERSIKDQMTAEQKALHMYTEGIICLMKRKLEEGVQIFRSLLKNKDPVLQDFLVSIYENIGFAYFSLGKYKKAVKSITHASKIGLIDKSSEFNSLVSEGILAYLSKLQSKSLKSFKKARNLFPRNPMPELLKGSILLHQSFKSEENLHMLIKAELIVDKLNKEREPESEIMFCRSVLKFCLKNFEAAYESAKKGIEKADENIPKHYFHRAFCNAVLKKYEEAVQDFSIVLQLNYDSPEVLIYRGISAYLQDDLQQAFDDFTQIAKSNPNNWDLLFKVSKHLSMVGSYEDSLQILESLNKNTQEVEQRKAQNYLLLFNLEKSLETLDKIPQSCKSKSLEVDREIISIILEIKKDENRVFELTNFAEKFKEKEGEIFNKKYLYWLIGVVLFYNSDFSSASSYFQAVLELLHQEEPEVFADSITIEEENCEILYNLALCSFSANNLEANSQALLIFEELAEVLNTKHKGQLLLLSAITEIRQKNKQKAEKLLKEAFKCDSDTVGPFLKSLETKVLPLHSQSDLANIFPLHAVRIEELPSILIKPSIVLPRVCLEVKIEEIFYIVSSFYKIETVVPRAEAPWLIRNKGSIQFTENLIEVSSDLNETEKSVTQVDGSKKGASQSRSQFLRKFKSQCIAREKSLMITKTDEENNEPDIDLDIKFMCNE